MALGMWKRLSRKQRYNVLGAAGSGILLIIYYFISGVGVSGLKDVMKRIEPGAQNVSCTVLSARDGMCFFTIDDIQKFKLAYRMQFKRLFNHGTLREKDGCLADDRLGEPFKDIRRSRTGVETYWFPARTKAWQSWRNSFMPKNAPEILVMYYFRGTACLELQFPLF